MTFPSEGYISSGKAGTIFFLLIMPRKVHERRVPFFFSKKKRWWRICAHYISNNTKQHNL